MAKKEKQLELLVPDDKYDLESIKNDLKDYVTLEIKKQYSEDFDKANRRLIKEKNKSLIWKNIIILFLICIIGFLLYLMYNDGYFKRLFNNGEKEITSNTNQKDDVEEKPKEEVKLTLDELKKEYGILLNDIYINEKSIYLKDFYQGKLYDELKNYLALNLVNFNDLNKEDDYNIIGNDTLRIKYNKIFDDEYKSINFDYNGNEVRYINVLNSYVTETLLEVSNSNIKRDITNILVDGDLVLIETDEYLIKDGKKYNILSNEEITDTNNTIIRMIYTFKNNNLVKLENKDMLLNGE